MRGYGKPVASSCDVAPVGPPVGDDRCDRIVLRGSLGESSLQLVDPDTGEIALCGRTGGAVCCIVHRSRLALSCIVSLIQMLYRLVLSLDWHYSTTACKTHIVMFG